MNGIAVSRRAWLVRSLPLRARRLLPVFVQAPQAVQMLPFKMVYRVGW